VGECFTGEVCRYWDSPFGSQAKGCKVLWNVLVQVLLRCMT
jgi:hypothetical protein